MLNSNRICRTGISRMLVILVVVLAAIGTAAVLLVSAIQRIRVAAELTANGMALKQLANGVQNFHDVYKRMPPAIGDKWGKHGTAYFQLLPFMESRMDAGLTDGVHTDFIYFRAGGDPSWPNGEIYEGKFAVTNFPFNWLALHGGPQKDGKTTWQDSFPDGLQNTVLFAMRYAMCNGTPTLWGYDQYDPKAPFIGYYNKDMFQIQPTQAECDPKVANTWLPVMQVAMCDASVRSFFSSVSARTWALALHPADGVPMPPDWID